MTPEGRVKAKVNRVLAPYIAAGQVYKFMPVQTGYGKKTLDYVLAVRGGFWAIETKAPGKEPTALQEVHIREITSAGGRVFVIDGDTTELEKALRYVCGSPGSHQHEAQGDRRPLAA